MGINLKIVVIRFYMFLNFSQNGIYASNNSFSMVILASATMPPKLRYTNKYYTEYFPTSNTNMPPRVSKGLKSQSCGHSVFFCYCKECKRK